ncbi:hypothetical protein STEG23_026389 [Scotinomys teguina]
MNLRLDVLDILTPISFRYVHVNDGNSDADKTDNVVQVARLLGEKKKERKKRKNKEKKRKKKEEEEEEEGEEEEEEEEEKTTKKNHSSVYDLSIEPFKQPYDTTDGWILKETAIQNSNEKIV